MTEDEASSDPQRPSEPTPQAGTPRPPQHAVQYKGAPLEAAKGPGLGCFWTQVAILAVAIVLTPLSAAWDWPLPITIVLLASMLVLLLFVGQTAIFLMRLVAADRRAEGRRRPMRSATKTVGEIEAETEPENQLETESAEERHVLDDEPPDGGVRE